MVVEYGGFTILSSPFFVEALLPFLLVFAIVFAILQKSEILGKGKKQTDALIALAVGLLAVAFGQAVGIIIQMVSFLAVAVVVLLVFMLLTAALFKEGKFELPDNVKIGFGILIFIAVAIAVLVYTKGWDWLAETFSGKGSSILTNVVFLVVIIGAIAAVIMSGGSGSKSGTESKS
jgi:hypothetical protein